jgi:hypothetical protein
VPTLQIYDQVLSSEIAFPELRRGIRRRADLHVSIDRKGRIDDARTRWICHHTNEGEPAPWFSVGRAASDYLLRFPGLGDFRISHRRRLIHCSALRDLPAATLRHVFLDLVVPLALAARGRTVLHAGAVLARGGVVAFMGDSGAGKSTLVASFAMTGHAVVADDCLLVTETPRALHAVPSYPGVRLWPDAIALTKAGSSSVRGISRTWKRRLGRRSGLDFASEPAPLRAVYVLKPVDQMTAGPATVATNSMSAREALLAFVEHAYRLNISRGAPLVQEFRRLCRLAEAVPVRRLLYRKHPDCIRMISEIVDRDLASDSRR